MKAKTEVTLLPEVKKNIRALLISAPRGLSVEDIEHDYHAMLGKPLPFKHFRCKSALEFLKTMPDVVKANWSNGILILEGIADESSKHIAKLVSRQQVNASKSRRIHKASINTKPLVVPDSFRRNVKELLSVYPNGVLGSSFNEVYARHYGEELSHSNLGFKSMSMLLNAINDIATIVKNPKGGYRVCAVVRKNRKPPPGKKTSLLPAPPTKPSPSNTLALGTVSQNSLSSKASQSTPHLKANMPLSRTESLKCNAHVIPHKRKPLTDLNMLHGNVNTNKDYVGEKTAVEKVKEFLDSQSGVSDSMKDELISVLAKRPNGVWAARLPFEFKTLVGKELDVLKIGFYSIIEMASAMPDVFRIERPFPNGDWLLFLAAKSRKDKNITKVYVPENAIGKGVGYTQQGLPDEFYIELYVTHIRSPDCFWIQLRKFSSELEGLQHNIREFYSSKESAQFMVDDSLLKLGQVCVARFPVDHEWYRALITATPSQFTVEVFYVDYGNSSQVSKSDLRLIKKEFFKLPSQAIKSKLSNITPKVTRWDPSVAHRMNELTENKGLVGLITESDKKGDVLDLCICDTNGNDDVYINDQLVHEGFAVFKQASGRTTPPGLPPAAPEQQQLNQQIVLNTTQAEPTFPDYSVPLNLFTGFPSFDFTPLLNMAPSEQPLQQAPEEIAPIIMDEEKPTAEDIEFMRQVCEELSDVHVVVKALTLPGDKRVHIVKFEEKPYLVRSEISSLLWNSDILRSKLRDAKKLVEKEVICREDHEELFNELRRLKVGDFADSEEPKEYASLFPLSVVPDILETFNHPSSELVQMIKNETTAYERNPGTYWVEESDHNEGTDDSSQGEPDKEHDLEELRLAEQALNFARKRILRAMTNVDLIPSEDTVDEAADVERRLLHIRELIAAAEIREAAKGTEGSKETRVAQQDNVIRQDIVGDVSNKELFAQPEQPSAKPVGITKPEMRRSSPVLNDTPAGPLTQYRELSTSTNNPNTPSSTPQNANIQNMSSGPYPGLPASTCANPILDTSMPPLFSNFDNPISTPIIPNIPTSIPHNPTMPNVTAPNTTQNNCNPGIKKGDELASIIEPDGRAIVPVASMVNHQYYTDLAQSAKKTIDKLENRARAQEVQQQHFDSKKKSRNLSHPNPRHVNQPLLGLPLFMPSGHMAHNINFHPGANIGPPNIPFQGFFGPFHPMIPPAPISDVMLFNGPMSAPGLVDNSQLLFQYGSPFPNPNRSQR
ncbi:tudor domain-containing protein 5-like isoform X2 [Dendronephthya gigantea]|uniref:tudor domain-containing protein 5-like isoform X2 n=1 Tax=Dendronephthya gigantea TaxID=151771 RepID=UPI00106C05CD|nr:tudor domain-containing protein 5-like isoform X2 [Dendronephthya gigantea]